MSAAAPLPAALPAPRHLPSAPLAAADLDLLARALVMQMARLELPVAHAAAIVCDARAWRLEGYARRSDYARERLDRSSRWLGDRAALGRALQVAPQLGEALLGRDGGPALGIVAAIEIARLVDNEMPLAELPGWISRARDPGVSAQQLRADAQAARRAMRPHPDTSDEHETAPGRQTVRVDFAAPPEVLAAFNEALELYRRVDGGQAGVSDFIEAMLAERSASGEGEGAPSPPAEQREQDEQREQREQDEPDEQRAQVLPWRASPTARKLPARKPSEALAALIDRVDTLINRALDAAGGTPTSTDDALDALEQLLTAERQLRFALGEALDRLRRMRPFIGRKGRGRRLLPYASLDHYAEERLGLSASVAERLARLHSGTKRYVALRESYENALAPEGATLAVLRLLDRSAGARAAEGHWVTAAECCTLRRIHDEARVLEGRDALREPDGPRPTPLPPMPDAEWLASLSRKPGESARHLRLYAARAIAIHGDHPRERRLRWMHLYLPFELAVALETALEDTRNSHPCTSLFATQPNAWTRPPRWAGLLVLLLEAVHEWEGQAEELTPREWSRRVYARDGYRCMAPGCTSRANLEEHHVKYRSAGGTDEASNRVTLCRFHHQQGEHGGLMHVSGVAPDGLLFRLGDQWFECDRQVDA